MARRAARVDDNQAVIVQAFRELGCTVACTHAAGDGFPDLVVGLRGINLLVEIKNPEKPPSGRKLTQEQAAFHGDWRGQVCVVETVGEAAEIVQDIWSAV